MPYASICHMQLVYDMLPTYNFLECLGYPSQLSILHLSHPTPPPLGSAPVALLRGDSSPRHQGAWTKSQVTFWEEQFCKNKKNTNFFR